jgi:hypothetical protein
MKKIFFTAIAVVAFVGTSMAKTVEVEKVEKLNVEVVNPCKEVFSTYLSASYSQGYSSDDSWAIASLAYTFCEAANSGIRFY